MVEMIKIIFEILEVRKEVVWEENKFEKMIGVKYKIMLILFNCWVDIKNIFSVDCILYFLWNNFL